MSSSTNDELEAIERAARSTSPMVERGNSSPVPAKAPPPKGRRRGSATFTLPKVSAMDCSPKQEVGPSPSQDKEAKLLELSGQRGAEKPTVTEYPEEDRRNYQVPAVATTPPPKRGSVVMKPMPSTGGLVDFEDSDFDDSDDEQDMQLPGNPMPTSSMGAAVGGPNHRPLVGGFAAAAYEAARAHHYANINRGKEKVVMAKRAGPPPSI